MKNINRIVFVLFSCLVAISSCQDIYKEEYGSVGLDYDKIDVKPAGEKYAFMVYCSGDWTIGFDKEVDWVRLDKTSGHGVTMVNIEFGENTEGQRSFNLLVSGGGAVKTVPVVQEGAYWLIEIKTAEELLEWNNSMTTKDRVVLMNDIDCKDVITSENWTPRQFHGEFFGNNKTIDNFVIEKDGFAAFFMKLEGATVKDLTFGEGCSITSTAPDAASNCVYAASLAGQVRQGASIINVVNKGTVSVRADAESGTSGDYLGGICAYFLADKHGYMTDCKNYGSVTYSSASNGPVYSGGISGLLATKVGLTVTGCENNGTIEFAGTNANSKEINMGGITGIANTVTFDSCVNLGTVVSNALGTNTGATCLGGIVGVMSNACGTITNCVNGSSTDSSKGALANNATALGVVRVGGFVGSIISKPINVTGFKNYGTVSNNAEVSNWTALGGVAGYIGAITTANSVSNCENHGEVLNTKVKSRVSLGGIVGFIQNANTDVMTSKNYGIVKNSGAATHGVTVGGIVGRIEGAANGENTISQCHNYEGGDVIFDAANADDALLSGVGGILGGHAGSAYTLGKYHKSSKITIQDCANAAEVKKIGAGGNNIFIGGIAGFLNGVLESGQSYTHVADVIRCNNETTAVVLNGSTGSGEWYTCAGGIVGYYRVSGEVNTCNNYGSVTNTTESNIKNKLDAIRVGGIVGGAGNGTMKDCINGGVVKDDSNSNAGCVGGIAGYVLNRPMTMTNCDNTNAVSGKFNSTSNPFLVCVGGVVGNSDVNLTLAGCDNSGNITSNRTTSATGIYMGGLVGRIPNNQVSLSLNSANVSGTMMSNHTSNSSKTCLGGLVGFCYANNITDCHSTMSITNTCSGGNAFVGGLAGQIESGIKTVISNCSVNSTISAGGAGNDGLLVGRLTHQTNKGSQTTITNVYVKGTFNDALVKGDNYTSYVFGTQDFGVNSEIKFGDYNVQ